jgi:hypothetical protein
MRHRSSINSISWIRSDAGEQADQIAHSALEQLATGRRRNEAPEQV